MAGAAATAASLGDAPHARAARARVVEQKGDASAAVLAAPLLLPCPNWALFDFGPAPSPRAFAIAGHRLQLADADAHHTTSTDGAEASARSGDEESPAEAEKSGVDVAAPSAAPLDHRVLTARFVWDPSLVLAKLLERRAAAALSGDAADAAVVAGLRWPAAGSVVVELGAGQGLAGLAAALLGHRVWLTDAPPALPQLRRNAELNAAAIPRSGAVRVAALDWHEWRRAREWATRELPAPPKLVLGADVVWMEDLVEPLVATLDALLADDAEAEALIAHRPRSLRTDERWFAAMRARGLEARELPRDVLHRDFAFPEVRVFRVRRAAKEL